MVETEHAELGLSSDTYGVFGLSARHSTVKCVASAGEIPVPSLIGGVSEGLESPSICVCMAVQGKM